MVNIPAYYQSANELTLRGLMGMINKLILHLHCQLVARVHENRP